MSSHPDHLIAYRVLVSMLESRLDGEKEWMKWIERTNERMKVYWFKNRLRTMQKDPAVEHNKNIKWSESPWNQAGRRKKLSIVSIKVIVWRLERDEMRVVTSWNKKNQKIPKHFFKIMSFYRLNVVSRPVCVNHTDGPAHSAREKRMIQLNQEKYHLALTKYRSISRTELTATVTLFYVFWWRACC